MMVQELFSQLSDAGIVLDISAEGNLVVDGPRQCLTPEVLARVRAHKAELLTLLRTDSANDKPTPCPQCGDVETWPTTKGPMCITCFIDSITPAPVAPEWITERDMSPESVADAFQRYRSETHGGQMPDLLHGILLSRFNLWLEAQGQRPTTLLALWIALGMADVSSTPPSLI